MSKKTDFFIFFLMQRTREGQAAGELGHAGPVEAQVTGLHSAPGARVRAKGGLRTRQREGWG